MFRIKSNQELGMYAPGPGLRSNNKKVEMKTFDRVQLVR